jgi:hypothetical protein
MNDVAWALQTARGVGPVSPPHAHAHPIHKLHTGPLHSTVAGRTDHLPSNVPNGSYVLPADIVSAMGEGNTMAGFKVAKRMFEGARRHFGGLPYAGGNGPYGQSGGPYGMAKGGEVAPHDIQRGARPRVFYKGSDPGDSRRIKTGDKDWDSHTFVSANPEYARDYGKTIHKWTAKPDAKILYEGTRDWSRVAGNPKQGENYLPYASRAAMAAKDAGYHAAAFKRQGDTGTTVFDPSKFTVEPHEPTGMASGGQTDGVPVAVAGGEHVLAPHEVAFAGNGDLEAGHRALDEFVLRQRAKTVKTLKGLPGPKRGDE